MLSEVAGPQSPQRLRWCQFYFHISSHKRAAYHIVHDFLLWGWVGSGWVFVRRLGGEVTLAPQTLSLLKTDL